MSLPAYNETTLGAVEAKLRALLAPLVDSASGGEIKSVNVATFSPDPESVGALLDRFKPPTRGAFLSAPAITFADFAGSARLINMTMRYAFLAFFAGKEDQEMRRRRVFSLFDGFTALVQHQAIARAPLSGSPFNFLKIESFTVEDSEEYAVAAFVFVVEGRNLQHNNPAR